MKAAGDRTINYLAIRYHNSIREALYVVHRVCSWTGESINYLTSVTLTNQTTHEKSAEHGNRSLGFEMDIWPCTADGSRHIV